LFDVEIRRFLRLIEPQEWVVGASTMLAQSDATMMNLTACSLTRFHEDSLLFLAGFVLACAGRRWRLAFH
jgi:hypothetical protein